MSGLNRLIDAQQSILLAEAGALLHNLGKVSRQFFEWQSKTGSPKYRYQHILQFVASDYPNLSQDFPELAEALQEPENQGILKPEIIHLLKATFFLPPPFEDHPYRIGELIEYLGQGQNQIGNQLYKEANSSYWIERIFPGGARLLHLLNRAHDATSGSDKEGSDKQDQNIWAKPQPVDSLFRVTPMGWEEPAPTLTDVDNLRAQVGKVLANFLNLPASPFPIQAFASELRRHLASALADTQRPVNDISVWDMGRTGAAFLKTAAAAYILTGRPMSHDDLSGRGVHNKLFWRVLSCQLNGIDYLERALSVAEVRTRHRLLTERLNHLRDTLENFPLAAEVYRDENGSFYLFPDIE
ncbi:MAG: hypothetical protein ACRERE_44470, partial [Candidatus Entotheonellia bacterium]